jgi:hypothetical protein
MRREISNFEYGWMNNQPTFGLNSTYINGMWIKVNDDYLYFDIELDKENLTYIINHSIALKYVYGNTTGRIECGRYKTYKGESKQKRENEVTALILNWFVGMYGNDNLMKKHYGEEYASVKNKYDEEYTNIWAKEYTVVENAMKRFAKEFCLV